MQQMFENVIRATVPANHFGNMRLRILRFHATVGCEKRQGKEISVQLLQNSVRSFDYFNNPFKTIMEPVYKPSALISSLKNFGTPSEYSSYYIKWLIDKPLSQVVTSEEFKAGRFEIDDSEEVKCNWQFKCSMDDESKSAIISFNRVVDEANYDAEPDIPIVCRLAMTNKVTGIMKYHECWFLESTITFIYEWKVSLDDARDLDLPNGDYVVYCWLDFPTKVIDNKSRNRKHRSNFDSALLSPNLFEEVVSSKTDESEGTSDIVLITEKGEDEERLFYCHRNVLSIRSAVFEAMFTSEIFKESNAREVEIEDVDGDIMEIALKYIYTGECPSKMNFDSFRRLIYVAEKYMLPELKDECVRQLLYRGAYDKRWADRLALAETYNIDYMRNISMLALSSNVRAMCDEKVREKLSDETMVELADMVAKRLEYTTRKEVSKDLWLAPGKARRRGLRLLFS